VSYIRIEQGSVAPSPSIGSTPREARQAMTRARPATQHSRRDRAIRRLLMIPDIGGLVAALLAMGVVSRRPSFWQMILWGLPTLPVWLGIFTAYGLYRRHRSQIGHGTVDDAPWLFHALLLGCPLMWFYFRCLPGGDDHFGKVLVFGATCGVSILLLRSVARSLGPRLIAPERLLLIGRHEELGLLARTLERHPGYGAKPVARVAAEPDLDVERLSAEHGIGRVVVAHGDLEPRALLELLRRCKELSIKVSVLPQVSDAMGPSVELDDVAGLTLIAINPPVISPAARVTKRAMDVVGATLLLTAFAPVMALIAVAIKLDSRGPVLFRQQRVGHRGRPFGLLKFRTMVFGAERRRDALLAESKEPGWLHLEHDPRITRVGRVLRHTSLDELPQLWNVLRGEMSLVGPRPLVPTEDANLVGWARTRLDLMPGLSGLWQVAGRTSLPFAEMIRLDYLYVTNWSLWRDVRVMLRTVPAVLMRRGVN
jgi:exopolysaccharide biosynthesis polyprenyl glycosylphosphotransferase